MKSIIPANALPLDIATLSAAYRGGLSPLEVMAAVYERIRAAGDNPVWITLMPEAEARVRAQALMAQPEAKQLPLYGIPFAVKDNIDVQGLPTTAACPAYAYEPARNATVVERLLAAGAICIGKTNLDQFATGLVGSRSPYGAVRNALNSAYVSGGSSSGSAVAVALGQVSFSLGTDTAGSGRVPAAFNNIVGMKPTRGRVSAAGVVPACRTLDCVSIFAGTCADAALVLGVAEGPDAADPYSRTLAARSGRAAPVIGVPRAEQLQWCGDRESQQLFFQAVERMERIGAQIVSVDFAPFIETGRLLYGGPWVAERYAAIREFFRAQPQELLEVTRTIIADAERYSAADVFQAQYRLADLKAQTEPLWKDIDALCIPTAPTIYTAEQERREPIALNSNLGLYTNFVNLLDLAGIAVPAAWRSDELPFGISLLAPAGFDQWLCELGGRFHAGTGLAIGATPWMPPLPGANVLTPHTATQAAQNNAGGSPQGAGVQLAVVGAHLSGEPLNHQLTERGARLLRTTRTTPHYRLFELPDSKPPKPGLVCSGEGNGAAIEVEIWELAEREFGAFVAAIPAPLGVGTLQLADGSCVKGFICESHATQGARDISSFGGWRAFIHPKPA